MFAFTSRSGIPYGTVNLKTLRSYNPSWSGGASGVARFFDGVNMLGTMASCANAHHAVPAAVALVVPMTAAASLHTGLAEFGSEQLEFIKLSDWTGNATYARLVEGNIALMHDKYPDKVRTLPKPSHGS
jgi:Glycosyl hydrolase family 47